MPIQRDHMQFVLPKCETKVLMLGVKFKIE
jgi:hypothetical protein